MHLRNRHFLIADATLLSASSALAFAARFESTVLPAPFVQVLVAYVAIALPLRLFALVRLGVYARLWRYAGQSDLELLCLASFASGLIGAAVGLVALPLLPGVAARVPLSVVALDALLGAAALTLPRLALRQGRRWGRRAADHHGARRALVVGAGAAGAMIVREMLQHQQLGLVPVAFVDDDSTKQHRRLQGIPVVGPLADIPAIARRLAVDEIVIAMPAAPGAAVRRVVQAATEVGVPTRTVPGLYELLSGRKAVSALRQVEIEDLLRRDPVRTDLERVRALAHRKTVLVTGAGGSIGSELCRQLARLGPAHLVVLGRGENSVFELLQELSAAHPGLSVEPVIADIRDRARLERVFQAVRPHSVFHAAAHKHVPLMEQNVAEAILNNVLGTQTVAELAARYGAERFVLISSDKAVRPSSVMGATKRLAEGAIQRIGRDSACAFIAVRFGNVLGSRGSVIPTFLRQIQRGGPVTITHPEMTRYFMTIPEAVQLVLQAGVMGEGGEVFVLDMGEPVRVVDLARDLIRLSGLAEDDVDIRFTGMRPGEKLYEELFFNEENASRTEHPKVLRALNARFGSADAARLPGLLALAQRNAPADELRSAIKALVPEYTGAAAPLNDVGPMAPADEVLDEIVAPASPLVYAQSR
jgi:FlaA1/EpsC-like NDP-sugar epimerase